MQRFQEDHLFNIDAFEHIRQMQLNKIRIQNATKWDVAKYDEYVSKHGQDYYENKIKYTLQKKIKDRMQTLTRKNKGEHVEDKEQKPEVDEEDWMRPQEQVINEEVRISDFAYSKFQEIREMDGIQDKHI